jgi:DNA modification methylase
MLNQIGATVVPQVRFQPNTIYCGDCKEVLHYFPEGSVDLIYADPPFFSNRLFEIIWNDGYELRAFEDRWRGGIMNYIAWMVERLAECQSVKKIQGRCIYTVTIMLHIISK